MNKQQGVTSVASNGSTVYQSESGDIPVERFDKNWKYCNYTVRKDVQYAVNRMLDQGWEARGKKESWWSLMKGKFVIRFDI